MNIHYRERALEDLASLAFHYSELDTVLADRFLDAIAASITRLSQMPYLGVAVPTNHPALFGLRRWPVKGFEKCLIFYLVLEDDLDLLRILHATQDIQAILAIEP